MIFPIDTKYWLIGKTKLSENAIALIFEPNIRNMKNIHLILLTIVLMTLQTVNAQDSLLRQDLSKHVYHFDLKDNQLSGPGADLLRKEAMKTQYFLIGEYHGSKLISNFTRAMIPILHEAGYQHFGVEVGPHSAELLKEMAKDPQKTTSQLNTFNQRYSVIEEDSSIWTPIPFFEYEEDAAFLEAAMKNGWNLYGLDQEFCYGYIPLIDRMYAQLSKEDQKELWTLHQSLRDSIQSYYKMNELDQQRLSVSMTASPLFKKYLKKASKHHEANQAIADALLTTTKIYHYNATRDYLECNSTRIDYMKTNLFKAFEEQNFDLKKDKMLLKMGSIHTAKGFSWLSLYELGNTLHELASFHQNESIHLSFSSRFEKEDGKIIDALDNKEGYAYRYVDLLQFGKKDQWTIIDLRPLKEKIYYHQKYKISDLMKDIFRQHDLFIIAPVEEFN